MKDSAVDELRVEARDLSRKLAPIAVSSPLGTVAERLVDLLDGVSCAIDHGQSPIYLRQAIAAAHGITNLLPSTFGRRFYFDAAVIASVFDEWAAGGARIGGFIIPRYAAAWGYYRFIMPSEDVDFAHAVLVVTVPGADRMGDIDLSDYPWLIHELAHDAFYRSEHRFRDIFGAHLEARLRQLRLRAAADVGSAARHAAQHIETLKRYWAPRADQRDWSHEIATDIATLWSLGPAFLMRFLRLLVDEPGRAWSAADQHPPYVTRAEALALGAQRLGWTDEMWALSEELRTLGERPDRDTSALLYADPELLAAAVEASLDACHALSIAIMKSERFAALRHACDSKAVEFGGADLVAAGAVARTRLSATDYSAWHDEVIGHAKFNC